MAATCSREQESFEVRIEDSVFDFRVDVQMGIGELGGSGQLANKVVCSGYEAE